MTSEDVRAMLRQRLEQLGRHDTHPGVLEDTERRVMQPFEVILGEQVIGCGRQSNAGERVMDSQFALLERDVVTGAARAATT